MLISLFNKQLCFTPGPNHHSAVELLLKDLYLTDILVYCLLWWGKEILHCVIAVSYRLTIWEIVSKQISHSTKELIQNTRLQFFQFLHNLPTCKATKNSQILWKGYTIPRKYHGAYLWRQNHTPYKCLTFWLTSLSFHRSWSIWFSYNITALGRWKQQLRKCKKKAESNIWIFCETWCQILYFPWQVNIAFFSSTF